MDRRQFVTRTTAITLGALLGSSLSGFASERRGGPYDLMKDVMRYRKIDSYATSNLSPNSVAVQLDYADRLGIDHLFIAGPMLARQETPEEFRATNDLVIRAVKQSPDRLTGQFTINPSYPKEAEEEIKRCVGEGLFGTRLYCQVKINDPLYYPFIERFSDLNMLIFMHGESELGVGGYRMKYDTRKAPTISTPDDFVDVAKRYPEAMFQFPHIGGGGDWESMCKAFRDSPNIYVDTGGSNNDEYMVDFALEHLGEDRVLFGSDGSYYQSVGKILASNLTDSQKRKIFFENYNKILKRGGRGIA